MPLWAPMGRVRAHWPRCLAGRQDYHITAGEVLYNGNNLLQMPPEARACEGIFLAFQYPVEIPGVSTTYVLRAAVNATRTHRGLEADIPQPRDGMGVMRGVGRISAWAENCWHQPTAVNPSITSASSPAGWTTWAWAMSWTKRPTTTRHGATSPSGQRATPWCAMAWDGSRHRATASPGAARLSPPPASWRPACSLPSSLMRRSGGPGTPARPLG
jgi:hypothetical protein